MQRHWMNGEIPETWGISVNQESIRGAEGYYGNVCQLKELHSQKSANISMKRTDRVNQVIQNPHTIQWNL